MTISVDIAIRRIYFDAGGTTGRSYGLSIFKAMSAACRTSIRVKLLGSTATQIHCDNRSKLLKQIILGIRLK